MTTSGRHRSAASGGRGVPGAGRVPGAGGLALRQLRSDPWVSVVLVVLVTLVALVATLWPRVVADISSRQAAYAVADLSVAQRDVVGTSVVPNPPGGGSSGAVGVFDEPEVTWAAVQDGLVDLREAQPESLRSVLEPGRFAVDVGGLLRAPSDPASDIRFADLQFRVDPAILDLVDIVEGEVPAPRIPAEALGSVSGDDPPEVADAAAVEIMLSQDAANELAWEVGEVRDVPTVGPTRVSGVYVPNDVDDPDWQQTPFATELATFFDGNVGETGRAAAYLSPGNPGTLPLFPAREFRIWFTLSGDALIGDRIGALDAQLAAFTATRQTVVAPEPDAAADQAVAPPAVDTVQVGFSSEVSDTLRELATGQRATSSILAVVAAGPLGVTLAVFALGARLVVGRRRGALALARARGGSDRQLRSLLALEGLVLGVPAALLGYAVAGLLLPGSTGWGELVVVAAVAVVPALALLAGPPAPSPREERSDLGGPPRRWRWIVELAVVVLAGLAVWRLLDRGLAGVGATDGSGAGAEAGPVGTGVDLLMAATPVLLALAACVLTLRVYPVPMHAVVRHLRGRPGLVPFLGAARAVRDPAGGLLPALAVILGVSVATFSTVLASTITDGAERAAWAANGAQVRVTGPPATPDLVQSVAAAEGVTSAAVIAEVAGTVNLSGDVTGQGYTVYVVDDTLEQVHAAAPLVDPFPAELYADSTPLPVLTGGANPPEQVTGDVQVGRVGPARVVGHVADIPGFRTTGAFLVVTRSAWDRVGGSTPTGTTVMVATTSAAPSAQDPVVEALTAAVPSSLIETPRAQLDRVQEAPVTSGLTAIFVAAVGLTLVLTVVTILLVQLMSTPSRVRLLAVLRTLGGAPRQARALTAWELGPLLGAAVLVGGLLGAGVPWLLLRAVDLRGLTGGTVQPALSLDPVVLGLVALGVLGTVLLAVTVSAALAGHTDLAQQLRVGEER